MNHYRAPPDSTGLLTWHHTEFGRRTTDGRFRVVRHLGSRWRVLDANWNVLDTCDSVEGAQKIAEGFARRTRR